MTAEPLNTSSTQSIERELYWAAEVKDSHWQSQANCGSDPDAMDPPPNPRGSELSSKELAVIHRFCGWCTVRPDCLAAALQEEAVKGIRGGIPQRWRKKVEKNRKQNGGVISLGLLWDFRVVNREQARSLKLVPLPIEELKPETAAE